MEGSLRGRQIDSTKGGRPTCYSCLRPESHCLCSSISPFEAHCNILILQHPNEWRKYYSTAKLVAKCLTNARLLRAVSFEPGVIERALSGQQPYLLFPTKTAQDCEEVVLPPNTTVIAIDGTWDEARKVLRRNPVLQGIPCLSFKPGLRSNYRIRKQPKENCLSTLESVGHFLKLSARANGLGDHVARYDRLFDAFERMVAQQLSYFPRMREPSPVLVQGSLAAPVV
jgi:DTW domain-containing protein YfiP